MKKMKKISRKALNIFIIIGVFLTTMGFPPFLETIAIANNSTQLEIQASNSNNDISIDQTDAEKLVYKIGAVIVGNVKVKVDGVYETPVLANNKATFSLPQWENNNYSHTVVVEVTATNGYAPQQIYNYEGNPDSFPGDRIINLAITKNGNHSFDFHFEPDNGGGPGEPMGQSFPIIAYFGEDLFAEANEDGKIIIPESWTSGIITLKAKICTLENGDVIPDAEECEGTRSELAVKPIIANSTQINKTVEPAGNGQGQLIANSKFIDYGKLALHVFNFSENDPIISQIISIETSDLIIIEANSPLGMTNFIGSDYLNKAIYTTDGERDASIFFGNTETTLKASGQNVKRIINVSGESLISVSLSNEGATLILPDLSVETTTTVEVEIELMDGSKITRTLNIKRTAIFLEHDDYKDNPNQVRAGYILNKNYLYNEEDGFDAYLQVILYKDNTVVGYKQIQINDDDLADSLTNESPIEYMNTFDWDGFGDRPLYDPIIIYDTATGDPDGVNGVSVFLTNGPIDFDSDTLPSIELGIGSGISISWEAE